MNKTTRPGLAGHLAAVAAGAGIDNLFRGAVGTTLVAIVSARAATPEAARHDGEALSSWVMILFVLPFIILASTAGTLGDRLSKTTIIRACRVLDLIAVALGVAGLWLNSIPLLLSAVAAVASISAFFAPVKLAVMPELVEGDRLPRANSWLAATTVLAILVGTAAASVHDPAALNMLGLSVGKDSPLLVIAIGLVALAICGLGIWGAWRVPVLPAINPATPIAKPWQIGGYFRAVHAPGVGVPSWCLALFWAIGAVAMVGVTSIVVSVFGLKESAGAMLTLVMAVGLIIGSLTAPLLMHRAYPAGLPIVGALISGLGIFGAGWAVTHIDPATITPDNAFSAAFATLAPWMFVCGLGGGLWEVPLTVLLQERTEPEQRNQAMAGTSVQSNLATLVLVGLLYLLTSSTAATIIGVPLHYEHAWMLLGGITVLGVLICLWIYRLQVAGWGIVILARTLWRMRTHGLEHLPHEGGCLLICNHLSFADGLALIAALPRRPRFLVHRSYCDKPIIGFFLRAGGAIPIAVESGRSALLGSIDSAVLAAKAGELVVIFPEGKLTRSGTTDVFRSGMERIANRAGVPIIPAWLNGFWGSLWSRAPRRRIITGRVSLRLGAPLPSNTRAGTARREVMALAHAQTLAETARDNRTLGFATLTKVRQHPFAICVIDAHGALSMWKTAAIARALIPAMGLADDERRVGIVLPPGRAGTLVNLALALDGRTAVNLNHTVGDVQLKRMADLAGLRTIITANAYLKRIGNPALPGRVLAAEDLIPRVSKFSIIWHAAINLLLPARFIDRAKPDDVAAIIFSSGSTGDPKGVQLTHRQILANCRGVIRALDLHPFEDVLLSPLPLFHSFGLMPGMWLGLADGLTVAAHPDPRDGDGIGKLAATAHATFAISTPSFVRGWMRRIEPEQFKSLRFIVAGAERCPAELRESFKAKYGADLLEGYGCTELAPVVAVNLQEVRRDGEREIRTKDGTVGRPLPGIQIVITDPATREILPPGSEGLLVVRSPARMLGYLNRDDLTEKAFIHDGYDTGDMGTVDDDGFVRITGRLARFAKIAGEMVPLDNVEAALQQAHLARLPDSTIEIAVASIPDATRGERLVVLHTGLNGDTTALLNDIEHLPALWRPKGADFRQVADIPKLGTGKRDLAALKRLAAE